jgi:energy-coupling factor transporter ATP-binding protein EcfA2
VYTNLHGPVINPHSPLAADLTTDQRAVLLAVASEQSVFMTGRAGCGKSKTLRALIACLKEASTPHAVTAYTGIAAEPLEGSTFHSYLCMRKDTEPVEDCVKRVRCYKPEVAQVRVLIIDEFSMVSETLMQRALDILQAVRAHGARKLVLVVSGDFLQLAPVRAERILNTPVWHAMGLRVLLLRGCHRQEGDERFLQLLDEARYGCLSASSKALLQSRVGATMAMPRGIQPTRLLSVKVGVEAINKGELARLGGKHVVYHGCVFVGSRADVSSESLSDSPARSDADEDDDTVAAAVASGVTTATGAEQSAPSGTRALCVAHAYVRTFVTPCNDEWEVVDTTCGGKHYVPSPPSMWKLDQRTSATPPTGMARDPMFDGVDMYLLRNRDVWMSAQRLVTNTLMSPMLELAVNSQVMFTANISPTVVNGTQGVVCGFHSETGLPIVETSRGEIVVVKPRVVSCPVSADKEMPCTAFVQVPLQLAWAWTVHKAQGQTLDFIDVDLGDTVFEDCQAYVALSRARCLSGVRLSQLSLASIRAPADVVQYYRELEREKELEEAAQAAAAVGTAATAAAASPSASAPSSAPTTTQTCTQPTSHTP